MSERRYCGNALSGVGVLAARQQRRDILGGCPTEVTQDPMSEASVVFFSRPSDALGLIVPSHNWVVWDDRGLHDNDTELFFGNTS